MGGITPGQGGHFHLGVFLLTEHKGEAGKLEARARSAGYGDHEAYTVLGEGGSVGQSPVGHLSSSEYRPRDGPLL